VAFTIQSAPGYNYAQFGVHQMFFVLVGRYFVASICKLIPKTGIPITLVILSCKIT